MKNSRILFTEPSTEELQDVSIGDLQIAALIMCGVNDSYARHVRTPPERGEIKPCLRRER